MNPTILRRRVEKTLPYIALGLYAGITFLAMVTTPAHGQTTPALFNPFDGRAIYAGLEWRF